MYIVHKVSLADIHRISNVSLENVHRTGLHKILTAAFGGVAKMLSGKKYPHTHTHTHTHTHNVRVLRLLTKEPLIPVFQEHEEIHSMAELLQILR